MPTLQTVLERARDLGFLGPGPVEEHIAHARAFDAALPTRFGTALDLGAGGGVPGLVLALARPSTAWTLLDASQRRTVFLEQAVEALELSDRVAVVRGRAEQLGHDRRLRGRFDVVVARSFATPSVVAECAAAFLTEGAIALVSEPPDPAPDRWPTASLATLGLSDDGTVTTVATIRRLRRAGPVPSAVPRAARVRRARW